MDPYPACFLNPTAIIDSGHPDVIQKAREVAGGTAGGPLEFAVRLKYAVRNFSTEDEVGDTR